MPQTGIESAGEFPSILLRIDGTERVIAIDHVPFTIGRKSDRDLVLNDPGISRDHAAIDFAHGCFWISDHGSRRGTFVNGERRANATLSPGDRISFGAPEPEIIFGQQSSDSSTQVLLRRLASDNDDSEIKKLLLFLQAARALDVSRVENDVLTTLLEYAIKLVGAERGFIYVRESDGTIRCSCGRDNRGNVLAEQSNVSRSTIVEVFETGADFVVGDTSQMSLVEDRNSIVVNDLRTVAAIALRGSSAGGMFGLLYLDSRLTAHNLTAVSHSILRAIASEAAALVENTRLLKANHAAANYRRELEIATAIQQSLVSVSPPELKFGRVYAKTVPCTEVGGDFYDFVVLPGILISILADISGKGISAALLASNIQGMLYSQLSAGLSLAEAASTLNNFLCSRVSGIKYATLIMARLAETGTLEIVNCGHVPPIIVNQGECCVLEQGNVPVGLFANARFESVTIDLPVGARLVLYSDGLTEAENLLGNEFGQNNLLGCLNCSDPLETLFQAVNTFSEGCPAQDDRTAVIIERRQG